MRLFLSLVLCLLSLPLLPTAEAADAGLSNQAKKRRIAQLYRSYKPKLGQFPEMTVKELLQAQRKGRPLTLVDARDKNEQRVSTLPGAILAHKLRQATLPNHHLVVVYCTIGYRSAQLVQALRRRGLNAVNLVGGVLSWTHAGQPLRRDGKPTRRLHVYGATWDLARSDIQTVH